MRASAKGRPIRAAGAFFAIWIAARLMLWESPLVQAVSAMPRQVAQAMAAAPPVRPDTAISPAAVQRPWPTGHGVHRIARAAPAGPAAAISQGASGQPGDLGLALTPQPALAPTLTPAVTLAAVQSPAAWPGWARPEPVQPEAGQAGRWSGDAWLLWREALGPVRAQQGFIAPAYGARQVGAVLRYRLAKSSARAPTLYLRGTRALERAHEDEVALGLSLRPVPGLPLVLGAELRGGDVGGAVRLRPALLAVTQLPPAEVPLLGRAEAYAQGGYVGGPFATVFVDGQLRLTRRLIELHGLELRAGAGAWGGAQRGAARADVGPTADVAVPLGPVTTRLSADWRFRVAGDAIPGSGPAITLSAGF